MSIEEIPADEIVTMTDFWFRAFDSNGCKPCCHATGRWINVGDRFLLATVKTRKKPNHYTPGTFSLLNSGDVISREIMVSADVDLIAFEKSEYKEAKLYKERQESARGGCFRINGKIVH